MQTQPYVPDSFREGMPDSPLQPLPPYLRRDFSQSLDRTRPHELVIAVRNGKPIDPKRQSCLTYRYLDTDETATVPNIWYNQTLEMRMEYWTFEVQRTARATKEAQDELAVLQAWDAPYYKGIPTERAVRQQRWLVEDLVRMSDTAIKVLADVKAGIRLA